MYFILFSLPVAKCGKNECRRFCEAQEQRKKERQLKSREVTVLRSVQKFPSGHRRCQIEVSFDMTLPVVEHIYIMHIKIS